MKKSSSSGFSPQKLKFISYSLLLHGKSGNTKAKLWIVMSMIDNRTTNSFRLTRSCVKRSRSWIPSAM